MQRRAFIHGAVVWSLGFGRRTLAATDEVVLVVNARNSLKDLDALSVRKLFLGLPVMHGGAPLHPLRNRSDWRLDPIFFQQIVAMSQSAYEREILIGVNRQGWIRPLEVSSSLKILDLLYSDVDAVSFLWSHDVGNDRRLRVIRVLWRE